jgi:hypothetical protein
MKTENHREVLFVEITPDKPFLIRNKSNHFFLCLSDNVQFIADKENGSVLRFKTFHEARTVANGIPDTEVVELRGGSANNHLIIDDHAPYNR